jgi:hypothetical protein
LKIQEGVMQFSDVHVTAAAATALEQLGWQPDHASVRDVVPAIARGGSAALHVPHAPAYAGPALAALVSALGAVEGGRALLLCPDAEVATWRDLVAAVTAGSTLRSEGALGPARVLRRLRDGTLDILVASPTTALTLQSRSALKADTLTALVFAWPELLAAQDDAIAAVVADCPKDAQRLVVTADPAAAAPFIERYARKAVTFGFPELGVGSLARAGAVRVASVAWSRRVAAVAEVLELLDPPALFVWTADALQHAALVRALPANDPTITVGFGDVPAGATVIGFDLPDHARLLEWSAMAGDIVLLAPPGTEGTIERMASPVRPLRLPSLLEEITREGALQRAAIRRTIEAGITADTLTVLAPLFERFDAVTVAGALHQLWRAAPTATPMAPPLPDIPATAKLFVGIGKKDGATINDLVAVLTKDLQVDRTKVGRVDLRDAFMLVEVPAHDAEQIAAALNGQTIRRRRIVARVDRGTPRSDRGPRPGGARPDGPPRRPRTGA